MNARVICCLPLLLILFSIDAAPARVEFKLPESLSVSDFAIDRAGDIYVCGSTENRAALGTNVTGLGRARAGIKPVVLKLSAPGGQIVSGVVLNSHAGTELHRITVSEFGKVVVTGTTSRQDGEKTAPALAVLQFDSACRTLLQSTILPAGPRDWISAGAICMDAQDNIFVGGSINGGFAGAAVIGPPPVINSSGFVAKVAAGGSVDFVSVFGGVAGAMVDALAVTDAGQVYAAGTTGSDDFPGAIGAPAPPRHGPGLDAFLVQLAPDGKSLTRSLLLGGEGDDRIQALTIDENGKIHVGGSTSSADWISKTFDSSSIDSSYAGFIATLDETGTNVLSSRAIHVGSADAVTAMRVDDNGLVQSAGLSGVGVQRNSSGFSVLYPEWSEYSRSEPFVAAETPSGTFKTTLLNPGCTGRFSFVDVRFGPGGSMYVLSRDLSFKKGTITVSAIARTVANAPDWRLLLASTAQSANTVTLRAVLSGDSFPGSVAPVSFYDGRRLIGTAPNPPYEITVSDPKRRAHSFSAATVVEGREVRSCRVPFRIPHSPRNDDFANSRQVRGERVTVRGSLAGATVEPFNVVEPSDYFTILNYGGSDPDSWLTWTAPRDGVFKIDVTTRRPAYFFVQAFTGSSLTNLQPVSAFPYSTSAVVRARAGAAYHVRISAGLATLEAYKVTIGPVLAPENDDFVNAIGLTGAPLEVSTSLEHATAEPGQSSSAKSVWYSWTAERTGSYVVTAEGKNSSVSAYEGGSIENLVSRGMFVTWSSPRGITFTAVAGEQLFLSVGDWGAGANTVLRIAELHGPANDNFTNAFLIAELSETNGTTLGATKETNEPVTAASATVWWRWRAPASGVFSFHLRPADLADDTTKLFMPPRSDWQPDASVLAIFRGSELQTLTKVATGSVASPGETRFMAEAGVLYSVRVAYDTLGSFTLSVRPNQAPENDSFTNAMMLVGEAAVRGSTRGASIESWERVPGGYYSSVNATVWYGWMAPSNGAFALELLGSAAMDIYRGETMLTLQELATGTRRFVFLAQGGDHYRIAVYLPDEDYWLAVPDFTLRAKPVTRPSNDGFSSRIQLEGVDVRAVADGRNATADESEPIDSRSLWWSWTAPISGTYAVESSPGLEISVFTGDSVETLQQIAFNDVRLTFAAVAGVTYVLRVNLAPSACDDVDLHLYYAPQPPNDDFENATVINSIEFTSSLSNAGATAQNAEPNHAYGGANRSLWWAWTPPVDGMALVTATSSNFTAALGIYVGENLADLQRLRSANGSTVLTVYSNNTYFIAVDSSSTFGVITLKVSMIAPPENDAFANPSLIGGGRVRGTFTGATTQPGEVAGQYGTNASSVWFKWRSPIPGAFMLEPGTQWSAGYYNWFTADVFTGSAIENLQPAMFGNLRAKELGLDPQRYWEPAYKLFTAEADTDYLIRISAPEATVGDYDFAFRVFRAPANDHFANRALWPAGTRLVRTTNTFATYEPGEPGAPSDRSVWWNWTAPTSGVFSISSVVSTNTVGASLGIYQGGELSTLTWVPSAYRTADGRLIFRAEAGEIFNIRVADDWLRSRGVMIIEMGAAHPPLNDDFARRSALLPTDADPLAISIVGSTIDATVEPGEPLQSELAYLMPHHSVWWSWTAPTTTKTFVEVIGSNTSFTVAVFTGSVLTNLQIVATNLDYPSRLFFDAVAGTNYMLRIAGRPSNPPGLFTLLVSQNPSNGWPPFLATAGLTPTLRIPVGDTRSQGAVLETSTNLTEWVPAENVSVTADSIVVPDTGDPARFYRWKRP